jgi:hypothetical protein
MEEILKEVQKEKMVTLTISVPESLRDKFKIVAIHNKTNIKSFITKYLEECVKKDREKGDEKLYSI